MGQRRLKGDTVTEKDGGTEKVKGRHGIGHKGNFESGQS